MKLEELLQQVSEVGEEGEERRDVLSLFFFFFLNSSFYLSIGKYRIIDNDYHTQTIRFLLKLGDNEAPEDNQYSRN